MKQSKKSSLSSKSVLQPNNTHPSLFARRFVKRALNTVKKFRLWQKGDAFIICVSGGPDSLCLLDVMAALRKKYVFTLRAAHVNYHLRGKDSDADETVVRKMAKHHRIPLTVLSKKKLVGASEETLRDIRYAFFESLRKKYAAQHIAIAHNQDDQAETLLLRLLRGAGLSGLSAMRAKNNFIVRPLIELSRAEILEYLKERDLSYREDKSNADPRYLRNRIRHKLIPFLEKNFQPQTRKLLAETAALLASDYAYLEDSRATSPITLHKNGIELSRATLLGLPENRLHYELRALLQPFLAGKNPDKNTIYELTKTLRSTKSKSKTVTFKGLKFVIKGDRVSLLYK